MPFDLFKFTINESTALCLLIATAEAGDEDETSDKCITDLVTLSAVTAETRHQEVRDVKQEGGRRG
jgi:hypothetical protein